MIKHTMAILTFLIAHNSVSHDNVANCDPSALTYNAKTCKAQEFKASSKNNLHSEVVKNSPSNLAESYDQKLKKADKPKKLEYNKERDVNVYISTASKISSSKMKTNRGMETQIAKVDNMKNGSVHKKHRDQLSVGATIPLKAK